MKKVILICSLVFANTVSAADSDYDNPSSSLICSVYTQELGREVRISVPLTEKGAVLEELVGGRYMLKVVAKGHRCIRTTEVRDLTTGERGTSSGDCSVNSYTGHKNADGEFTYYHFCKTTI